MLARAAWLRGPALVAVGLAVLAPPAWAAPDSLRTYLGPEVQVVAPGLPALPVAMAVATLDVEQLVAPGTTGLAGALRGVPGVRVARYGGSQAAASVSVRGASHAQCVVVLDGRRVTDARGGGVELWHFDPRSLASAQVVRGAAGALYGPSALGGALVLESHPRRHPELRAQLETGSLGLLRTAVHWAAPLANGVHGWVRGTSHAQSGSETVRDPRRATDWRRSGRWHGGGGAGGVEWRRGTEARAHLEARGSGAHGAVPGTLEFPTPEAERTDRRWAVAAGFERQPGASGRAAALTYEWSAAERFYLDRTHHQNSRQANDTHTVRAGLDWVRSTGRRGVTAELATDAFRSRAAPRRSRQLAAVAGHWRHRQWALAYRWDATTHTQPFLSGRASWAWVSGDRWRFRAGAGRAFRPPSYADLFAADLGLALGNDALRAERALEVDAGVTWRMVGGVVDAQVFWRSIEDLIQWVPSAGGVWRPHNVGRADSRGVELAFEGEGRGWSWQLSGTLLDAVDRTGAPNVDGRRLVYRPGAVATSELSWKVHRGVRLGTTWYVVSDSYVTRANTKSVRGYGLIDCRATWQLLRQLTVGAALLNAGDRSVADVRNMPLSRRQWRFTFAVDPEG